MIPISSEEIRSFRHRSKWFAYLLLKSIEALHKSGNADIANQIMTADKRWIEIHHKDSQNG